MTNLLPYITSGLRFAPDDTPCRPGAFSCNYRGEGPAMAIHTWKGRHLCAYHSPFDNKYVPCAECGEKPALMDGDGVCDDCLVAINRVTEYDHYLAMTGAHDLRHPNRPAPVDLPVSDYVDYHTKEKVGANGAAGRVRDEGGERAANGRYVSDAQASYCAA
ncbi:hypothetical protein ABT300_18845 [Streptomyces sp. NPDC001027]|uniref:hypothetical protein n=1 Tax=Streptomyces sp. NPDC001027 TaxID=3154771 RepID=UPI0033182196